MGMVGRDLGRTVGKVIGEVATHGGGARVDGAAAKVVEGLGRDHFPGAAKAAPAAAAAPQGFFARNFGWIGKLFGGEAKTGPAWRRVRSTAPEGPFRASRRVHSRPAPSIEGAPLPKAAPIAVAPPRPLAAAVAPAADPVVATVAGKPYTRQALIDAAVEKEPSLLHPFGDGPGALSNDALLDIAGLKPPAPPAPVHLVPETPKPVVRSAEQQAEEDAIEEALKNHPFR